GLKIDHELELRRRDDWHLGRLLAFENAARIDANPAIRIGKARSVAHQTAGHRELAQLIDCRYGISRRQCHQLIATAIEKSIGADQKRSGTDLSYCRKGDINLLLVASTQDMDLLTDRVCRYLDIFQLGIERWIGRIQ